MQRPRVPTKRVRPQNSKQALRRLVSYLRPHILIIGLCCICALVGNLCSLMGPKFAGEAIAAAEAGKGAVDFGAVAYYAKRMLFVYVMSNLLTLAVNLCMMRVSRRVAQQLRRDVFHKMMRLNVAFFDRNQAGDIISRVSYDVDVVCTSLSTDVVQIMTSMVTVLGSLWMMCRISLPLVTCMLVTIPLSVFYTRWMGKRTRPLYARRSAAYGAMNGYVEEMFSGQKTIVAYAHEDGVCEAFGDINHEAAESYFRADALGATMGPTVGAINNLALALIGFLGALLYRGGVVNLGKISSFVLYSRKFSGPINEIANIVNEIYSALSASERIFRMLDEPEETADLYGATELTEVQGNVKMQDVTFGYDPEKPILKKFDLLAKAGQTVAIVGATGAGKTTIINLLMRFYDVQDGSCFVDEKEIRTVTRDSLRRSYAMVLQDTWVFRGTIFENIAYGKENATMEEVAAAAKAAHIHNYILRLPDGYNTVITEDGGNISKGQKQLLTIARAMLYDTSMLILDEATSNVDTRTERQVQAAMRRLMQGKTCFVIAHRLSTIRNADNILVLDHGNVVEQGNHDALMRRKGAYYSLYASQFA